MQTRTILLTLAALLIGLAIGRYLLAPAPDITTDPYADDPVGIVTQPCIARDLPQGEAAYRTARAFLLSRDFGERCYYSLANAQLREAGSAVKLVMMGDSITQVWPDKDADLFADGIVGRGISGQTTSQMLVRFRSDVVALAPEAVHIMAGTNDIAGNTGALTLETLKGNYRSMAEMAQAHDIEVIFASIPPASTFDWREDIAPADTIRAVNSWLADYSAENGFTFIDYHSAMANAEGGLPEELGPDGVHPNEAGYAIMRGVLEEALVARAN